jgi:hypothetical protein
VLNTGRLGAALCYHYAGLVVEEEMEYGYGFCQARPNTDCLGTALRYHYAGLVVEEELEYGYGFCQARPNTGCLVTAVPRIRAVLVAALATVGLAAEVSAHLAKKQGCGSDFLCQASVSYPSLLSRGCGQRFSAAIVTASDPRHSQQCAVAR